MLNCSSGTSLENAIHVKNEANLKNAVNNAPDGKSAIISIDSDIVLTESLRIPDNKDIVMTSNKSNGYYKLNGAPNTITITVESGGVLKLDGVIITHVTGVSWFRCLCYGEWTVYYV
jgi:hypothetical protein